MYCLTGILLQAQADLVCYVAQAGLKPAILLLWLPGLTGCMYVQLYLVPPYSLYVYLRGRYIHVYAFMCVYVCVWGGLY